MNTSNDTQCLPDVYPEHYIFIAIFVCEFFCGFFGALITVLNTLTFSKIKIYHSHALYVIKLIFYLVAFASIQSMVLGVYNCYVYFSKAIPIMNKFICAMFLFTY